MWHHGELPFLILPEVPFELSVDRDSCRLADRRDHCVPIFKERVELVSGMPAGTLMPEKAPKANQRLVSVDRVDKHRRWKGLR